MFQRIALSGRPLAVYVCGGREVVTHPVLESRAVESELSIEEVRLLSHLASGMTADVAARRLDLSPRTLRRRVRAVCDRLGVETSIQAVVWAAKRGFI